MSYKHTYKIECKAGSMIQKTGICFKICSKNIAPGVVRTTSGDLWQYGCLHRVGPGEHSPAGWHTALEWGEQYSLQISV